MQRVTPTLDAELLALQEVCRGRYAIEREIGRGGMGIVALARDVSLDRPVAIKLLPRQLARQPDLRERFLREARIAAGLSHPDIVPIHAVEEHGDVVFFVMGYVDGETLARRVARDGPLSPGDAARLIREVAWALAYAHGRGIVHRDVKPDNIMIARATRRALVTDFGIARVAHATRALTVDGHVMGTAQFMSPEQAAGEPVDARSDIYALGVVAFHALTGTLPFEAESLQVLLAMQVTQPPPPVASRRRDVPPRLARAVDRCLAKRPEERFQSAEALADALADVQPRADDVAPEVRAFRRAAEQTGIMLWGLGILLLTLLPSLTRAQLPALLGALFGMSIGVIELLRRAREVLRDGFAAADVRAAFEAAHEARVRDYTAIHARSARRLARARRLYFTIAAAGVVVAGASMAVGTNVPRGTTLRTAARYTFLGATGLAAAFAAFAMNSTPKAQRRSAGFLSHPWRGRFTDWFFGVAGLALAREARQGADGVPAATPLELPEGARRRFPELPALLAEVAPAVATLRRREGDLERALAEAGADPVARTPVGAALVGAGGGATPGGGSHAQLLERRLALVAELRDALEAALQTRGDLSAAAENVRIGVSGLSAGVVTADDLAPDVEALALLLRVARGPGALA
jgi:eukaryotic-like serine/threonine-protein kinase